MSNFDEKFSKKWENSRVRRRMLSTQRQSQQPERWCRTPCTRCYDCGRNQLRPTTLSGSADIEQAHLLVYWTGKRLWKFCFEGISVKKRTRNVSWQKPHVTLHIPGIVGTGGVTGEGARLMMRLQFGRGQATRCEEDLQINRQLQGHRTYFLPGGAFLMGWKKGGKNTCKSSDG